MTNEHNPHPTPIPIDRTCATPVLYPKYSLFVVNDTNYDPKVFRYARLHYFLFSRLWQLVALLVVVIWQGVGRPMAFFPCHLAIHCAEIGQPIEISILVLCSLLLREFDFDMRPFIFWFSHGMPFFARFFWFLSFDMPTTCSDELVGKTRAPVTLGLEFEKLLFTQAQHA